MSSAVIGNADKLSSTVMAARKKLQGSIAAIEAAVRCEKDEEEQQRHRCVRKWLFSSINRYSRCENFEEEQQMCRFPKIDSSAP